MIVGSFCYACSSGKHTMNNKRGKSKTEESVCENWFDVTTIGPYSQSGLLRFRCDCKCKAKEGKWAP